MVSLDMRAMLRLNVDMKSSATLSIGELAGHFGLATHVLRHWETMGLLSPARAAGGRRRYGRSDLYRVASILLAKEAGLALADIRDMLATTDIGRRREIQRRHRDALVRKIAEMRAAVEFLEGGLACDYEDITECPNYRSLVAGRIGGNVPGLNGSPG
ncbi:MerR family transcriptional regulator [Actinomadura sp. 21ATH]|uniref:MerR family transcriptional regulator n=1 Tax=Actinomadura sp. 21ATH TaxID=1735444 RepID=UPI0035BEEEA0